MTERRTLVFVYRLCGRPTRSAHSSDSWAFCYFSSLLGLYIELESLDCKLSTASYDKHC